MSFDINKFRGAEASKPNFRYSTRLKQLEGSGRWTDGIKLAVQGASNNIQRDSTRSFVIYGEPQSGKTEMMIALTARLLDDGHKVVVVLLNDSVQLLEQNLDRFARSGLDPAPKRFAEVMDPTVVIGDNPWVIFCKKNSKDLQKLLTKISQVRQKVIIDDEADYATPNGKINKEDKTKINALVEKLIGKDGVYIGVTATPARLDLNNTFENNNEKWIDFPTHPYYIGQDVFFPTDESKYRNIQELPYYLVPLPEAYDNPRYLREALFSFFVNVADLNLYSSKHSQQNYCMLIHTSGKKVDHSEDYKQVVKVLNVLKNEDDPKFAGYIRKIWDTAQGRYPGREDEITLYIKKNIGRNNIVVMNSNTEKAAADYKTATNPAALFTIAIGGNIVSRGVTFENLLSMFFTRDVKHKIQQDTYIQRARMFGDRGKYLEHFELHIPEQLYLDWQKCFVFHRLALSAIRQGYGSPVWLEDARISAAAPSSISKANVTLDSGEMSWQLFRYDEQIDLLVSSGLSSSSKLTQLESMVGEDSLPAYVLDFVKGFSPDGDDSIAVHPTTSIGDEYSGADIEKVQRSKGFVAGHDLEKSKYPAAIHHFKIYKNKKGNARVFYKYSPEVGKIKFLKKRKAALTT